MYVSHRIATSVSALLYSRLPMCTVHGQHNVTGSYEYVQVGGVGDTNLAFQPE
jgi:hypothetical protein